MLKETEKIVLLENVRSAYNVGATFRTAEGAGVSEIIIGGYTPAPKDRFGREVAEIKKTSLGASEMVSWRQVTDIASFIKALKEQGYQIVAVEQAENSVSLYDFSVPEKVVYIFGNEVDGVSAEVLALSDTIVEIPMAGRKESLNVSVTAGIVLFYR